MHIEYDEQRVDTGVLYKINTRYNRDHYYHGHYDISWKLISLVCFLCGFVSKVLML